MDEATVELIAELADALEKAYTELVLLKDMDEMPMPDHFAKALKERWALAETLKAAPADVIDALRTQYKDEIERAPAPEHQEYEIERDGEKVKVSFAMPGAPVESEAITRCETAFEFLRSRRLLDRELEDGMRNAWIGYPAEFDHA